MSLIILFLIAFFVYLAPGLIASQRQHPSTGAIFALNVFLGWSLLGWVAALVWALSNPPTPQVSVNLPAPEPVNAVHSATKTCPKCAEEVKAAAVICRYCSHQFG